MWLLITGMLWISAIALMLAVAPDAFTVLGTIVAGTVLVTLLLIPFVFWGRVLASWVQQLFR